MERGENDRKEKHLGIKFSNSFSAKTKKQKNFQNFVLVPGDGALDPVDVVRDLGVHPGVVRPGTAQAPADNSDLSLQCGHKVVKGLANVY